MTLTVSISALLTLVLLLLVVAFKVVVVRAVSPFRTPVIVPSAAFGDVPGAVTAADKDDGDSDRAAWNQWPVAAAKNGDERILRGVLRLFPFSESDGKGLRSLFRGVSGRPLASSAIMTTSTRLEVLEGMSGMGFFWWGSMVGELK